jgi:two-component system, chemotaxis family, protein-glutamate methylesterase/glutaminase
VQDPSEALAAEMPRNAIRYAEPDCVLRLEKIAELLIAVSAESRPLPEARGKIIEDESKEAKMEPVPDDGPQATGEQKPSAFACPECHGVLWEMEEREHLRYRCRVGHAYTADTLRVSLSESAENSLWAALRAVEEKAALLRRVAHKLGPRMRAQYEQEATGFDGHAKTLRKMLADNRELVEEERGFSDVA